MANTKQKGNQWERDVSKMLSKWWSNGETEDIFWRAVTSGGWATTRAKKGKTSSNQYGDITAIHPDGQPLMDRCILELKAGYKRWSLLDIVDRLTGKGNLPFQEFLLQTMQSVKSAGDAHWPVLITKRDRRKPIITITDDLHSLIAEQHGDLPKEVPTLMLEAYLGKDFMSTVTFPFEAFLEWCPPDFFKNPDNKHKRKRNKSW